MGLGEPSSAEMFTESQGPREGLALGFTQALGFQARPPKLARKKLTTGDRVGPPGNRVFRKPTYRLLLLLGYVP